MTCVYDVCIKTLQFSAPLLRMLGSLGLPNVGLAFCGLLHYLECRRSCHQSAGPVGLGTRSVGQGSFAVRRSVESGTRYLLHRCPWSFQLFSSGDWPSFGQHERVEDGRLPTASLSLTQEGHEHGVVCGLSVLCVQMKIQVLCEKGGLVCVGETGKGGRGGSGGGRRLL